MRDEAAEASQKTTPQAVADIRAALKEAFISMNAALTSAEVIGLSHGIEDEVFDRVIELMKEALDAVARLIEANEINPPSRLFTDRFTAKAYCEEHPLKDPDSIYRILHDSSGRF